MENKNPLISIVIPCYQVGIYLEECLDSILIQSLSDFELILIDDGSTDQTGSICDAYAKKDSRIIVIHQENRGLSAARNRGLDIARGEYFTLVDSDDVILCKDYLKYLYEALVRNNAQISMCGLASVAADGNQIEYTGEPKEFLICAGKDYWGQRLYEGFFPACAYAKLYHRDVFKNIRYPEGRNVEDQAVIHRLVYPCEKIVILDAMMYGYRRREGSIMTSSDPYKMLGDILYAFEDRRLYFLEQGREDLAKHAETEMFWHIDHCRKRIK